MEQTKQRTLEEIAAAFGDKVVDAKGDQVIAGNLALGEKGGLQHVEAKV